MAKFSLVERKPTLKEFVDLRKSVGWGIPDLESLAKGLDNSLYWICATAKDEVIGMARVVGDGATVFYIQDVVVYPSRQRMGIGREMMKKIMDYIGRSACKEAIVGLMAAKEKEEFYQRFGFWVRPNENFGAGMMQFWQAGQGANSNFLRNFTEVNHAGNGSSL